MRVEVQTEGNYYDKYHTKNIIEKYLMKNFFDTSEKILKKNISLKEKDFSILEAGCGEGYFTLFLRKCFKKSQIEAFDNGKNIIKKAEKLIGGGQNNINFYCENIYDIHKKNESFELVIASEVLEHLEEPKLALRELIRVSKKYIFCTVPNEPIWRILNIVRGKYWKELGNTPGHIQHWNKRTLKKMFNSIEGVKIVDIYKSLPWLLILIEKVEE